MAAEQNQIVLTDRKELSLLGVSDVVSFDDAGIELVTGLGRLLVSGAEMKITDIDMESGRLTVSAKQVDCVEFLPDQIFEKRGFFGRIFSRS